MGELIQFLFAGITMGAIYSLVGLGFNLIYNSTGVINFAQGEFVMLGGMFLYTLQQVLHLPLLPSLFLVFLGGGMVGILAEFSTVRPLAKHGVITMIIGTIGLSIALKGIAMVIWGKNALQVSPFVSGDPIPFLGAALDRQVLLVCVVTLFIMLLLWAFFELTLLGKAIQACAINQVAAKLMGIPVEFMVLLSFFLSGAISALAGAFIVPITLVEYGMGTMLGLKGFCAAILGGIGNNLGAVLGGILLGLLEGLSSGYISSTYKDAIAFLLLVVILICRPQGILGKGGGERV